MSKVEFSSSSVLGTLASSRTFPLVHRDTPPRSRVCRSLFGPVDHEELNREMKAKLREIAERDQRRWNFNFSTGVPLLGQYEWEETPGETSPAFYQECVRVGRNMALEEGEKPSQLYKREDTIQSDGGSCRESCLLPENVTQPNAGKLTCRTVPRKRPSPLTTTRMTGRSENRSINKLFNCYLGAKLTSMRMF